MLAQLVKEQGALRRIAELIARDTAPAVVFATVAEELGSLLEVDGAKILRYDHDEIATFVGSWGELQADLPVGARISHKGTSVSAKIFETHRPARVDDYAAARGELASHLQRVGMQSAAGAPILVAGRLWGAMIVGSVQKDPLPAWTEESIEKFAQLTATAVASVEVHEQIGRLAEEQGALRRIGDLVARGLSEDEVFAEVAAGASRVVGGEDTVLARVEADKSTVVASHGGPIPVGATFRLPFEDQSVAGTILRTLRPARLDQQSLFGPAADQARYGVTAAAGVPIVLKTELWGILAATRSGDRLPVDTEARLAQFGESVVAALANVQAREELHRLAEDQSALRRVAELVARGASPEELFEAVTREASLLLDGLPTSLTRYEGEDELVVIGAHGGPAPVGWRLCYDAETLPERVRRTRRVIRVDDYSGERDAHVAEQFGLIAAVAAPVMLEGRIWGMLTATSLERRLPGDTERRLLGFADLLAAAISEAETRATVRASRARIIAAADESRRRVQRDVHDGAQQRLVQTIITLKLARDALRSGSREGAADLIDEALLHAELATANLRDVVRGILPAALSRGGLLAGVQSLVEHLPIEVDVDVAAERLPSATETTGYFVIAEALTNVVKHARATRAAVATRTADGVLEITITDDGVGGADPAGGTGLTGLIDRVHASEGELRIDTGNGRGTTILARIAFAAAPKTARNGASPSAGR